MTVSIFQGGATEELEKLDEDSVHCVVTSPPYWQLRNYGMDGEIGQEQTLQAYIANLMVVFTQIRRVLRPDGTVWLNIGDTYATQSATYGADKEHKGLHGEMDEATSHKRPSPAKSNLKHKDLSLVPHRLAIALQDQGWYVRNDIIWYKRSTMPENVNDRCTTCHEHIFLLALNEQYFYDDHAIREEGTIPAGTKAAKGSEERHLERMVNSRPPEYKEYDGTRNKRDVWDINPASFPDAHFATFPPELPRTCIQAGTSEKGACSDCGTPYNRIVEVERTNPTSFDHPGRTGHAIGGGVGKNFPDREILDERWEPGCECDADTVPCVVLDPFMGAGTTGMVADQLRRDFIGIELNPEYVEMAQKRIIKDAPLISDVQVHL